MLKYQSLLRQVLNKGVDIHSRNAPVRSLIGQSVQYDLRDGFPLLTTKKMAFKAIKGELIGFIQGYTHVEHFQKLGCRVWDLNAEDWDQDGDLGPIYGYQWRKWFDYTTNYEIDQLQNCIDSIKKDPFSRRHIVSAWNPAELDQMCLPPCHTLFQFHVYPNRKGEPEDLSLTLYQRSGDIFLGVPFNIASYSLLLKLVARVVKLRPLYFTHHLGDVHLYHEHFDQALIQLQREPKPLPQVEVANWDNIDAFGVDDILLKDYECHEALKARMIV